LSTKTSDKTATVRVSRQPTAVPPQTAVQLSTQQKDKDVFSESFALTHLTTSCVKKRIFCSAYSWWSGK